jgi:uncharacterized protein with NRDE domain
MCLILFAVDAHPEFELIIAANRDEFYERPTMSAHVWHEPSGMIAGKDLEGGGTWLGLDLEGRLSMLTNYRDPDRTLKNAPTRGALVRDFFMSGRTAEDYIREIEKCSGRYDGFNLICADREGMHYTSNYSTGTQRIGPGIHGLSNALLNDPWPKVDRGKRRFQRIIQGSFQITDLFDLLYDDRPADDMDLPDTGIGKKWEKMLSPIFIKAGTYGSRTSSVILKHRNGNVMFSERSYDIDTFEFSQRSFQFQAKHS